MTSLSRRLLLSLGGASATTLLAGALRAEGIGSLSLPGLLPPVAASEPPLAGRTPVRIGAVALRVREIAPMAAFYTGVIGLRQISSAPDEAVLGAGNRPLLHLIAARGATQAPVQEAGLFHTAFLMPDRASLARWLVHAARLKTPITGAADHSVSEAIYLDDPEGNGIEVYADRPTAQWQWRNGIVTMGTFAPDIEGLLAGADMRRDTWDVIPDTAQIGHVHLKAGDAARARDFYEARLGFARTSAPRPDAAFMSSGGYHHHLAVNSWQSAGAGPRDPAQAGLGWLQLEVRNDSAWRDIMARNGTDDVRAASDRRQFTLHDPWGTELRLIRA